MSSTPSNPRLTPPIVEPPIADDLPDDYVPYEPKESVPAADPLDEMVNVLKTKRAAVAASIEEDILHRAELMTRINEGRAELKRLDRFIAAETPRGSKPKTK